MACRGASGFLGRADVNFDGLMGADTLIYVLSVLISRCEHTYPVRVVARELLALRFV